MMVERYPRRRTRAAQIDATPAAIAAGVERLWGLVERLDVRVATFLGRIEPFENETRQMPLRILAEAKIAVAGDAKAIALALERMDDWTFETGLKLNRIEALLIRIEAGEIDRDELRPYLKPQTQKR